VRLVQLLVIVIALPLAAGSPAGAAEPAVSPEASARQHFDEGTKLFNLGEFAHAVIEYKAAYKAKADPVFLYNIAQAYRLSGDLGNAVFFYRSYLRNHPSAPNRREVEGRVRNLEQQLQQQKVVTTTPPNSAVPPGGTTTAAPEPASEPTPTAATAAPEPAAVTTPSSSSSTSTAPTATAAPARADLVATSTPARDAHTPVYKKWWLWTIVGVAAVGAGVGLGVGLGMSHSPNSHFGTTTVSF
jgi:hypothetical protein